jgi:6-phosphogluconolactonase
MRFKIFPSKEKLYAVFLPLLKQQLTTPGAMMLSGGKPPFSLYSQLASSPFPIHPQRILFMSDERMVARESPESNVGNLKPFLHALNAENRFIPLDTSLSPTQAAEKFNQALQPLKNITFGLLGLGTDGHTAGIFTPQLARQKEGSLALSVHRPDGLEGVTVTPPLIQRVEQIVLLVLGSTKREILQTLHDHPQTIPAGILLASHPSVEIWTDQAVQL